MRSFWGFYFAFSFFNLGENVIRDIFTPFLEVLKKTRYSLFFLFYPVHQSGIL